MFNKTFKTLCLLTAAGAMALTTGCGAEKTEKSEKPQVVVGSYPFQYAAEAVAGENAEVTNLLSPGSDAHDLELTAKQVSSVGNADLVVYQSKLQSALDDAVEQQKPKNVLDTATFLKLREADASAHNHEHGDEHDDHDHAEGEEHSHDEHPDHDHTDHEHGDEQADHDHADEEGSDDHDGHDHGKYDPHVWLDPSNVAEIGNKVADELAKIDQANADSYKENAKKLTEQMNSLDGEFKTGLASCQIDTFVTNHAAFGYLADRYGLHQVGISGLSTEEDPSPARIEKIHEIAKEKKLTTIFYEQAVSPKVSETIAKDLGLQTDVLDPLETLSDNSRGKDYVEVMHSNLDSLRKANSCK